MAEEQSDKGPPCQPGLLLCLSAARRFELGQQGVGNRLGLGEIPIAGLFSGEIVLLNITVDRPSLSVVQL